MRISQLKAGVVLSYISMGIGSVISILYTPLMLRLLGTSEYGLYNLVYSVISYLGLLSFGFGSAYMRYYSRYRIKDDEENIGRLNGMFLIIFTVIGLITIVAGLFLINNIGAIFGDGLTSNEINKARVLMIFMVFSLAISFPGSVFTSNITASERYIFQRIVDISGKVINPFLTLPLLLMGYKSIALVATTTAITIITNSINVWYCLKVLNMKFRFGKFNIGLMKEIWIFSFYIFLNMIVEQINWSVDKFIIGVFRGTGGVAVYSIGAQINSYYLSFSIAISSVFIPRVNRMVAEVNDNKQLTELFTKVGRIQLIAMSFILSAFVFFGEYFIHLWAGNGYEEAYFIALILMIPVTVPLIQNLGIEIQRAKNVHKFRSIVYVIIAVANVLISIPLTRLYGGIGAALGTAITLIAGSVFIMNIYYHKKIRLDMKYFWREVCKLIPSFIVPVLIGLFLKDVIRINNIMIFLIGGIVYSLIFIMSIYYIGMNNYEKDIFRKPFRGIRKYFVKILAYI